MKVSRETLMAVPLYGTYVAAKAIHENKREMKIVDKRATNVYQQVEKFAKACGDFNQKYYRATAVGPLLLVEKNGLKGNYYNIVKTARKLNDSLNAKQYISNKKMKNQTYKMYLIPVLGTIYGLFKAIVRNYQQKQLLKAFDEIKSKVEVDPKVHSKYNINDNYVKPPYFDELPVKISKFTEPAPEITNKML